MLKQLIIQNYALIEHTDLELGSGLSVITGETGAGKSIMLGALGMLLGQKADSQVLLDKDKKCVVEATFDIAAYDLEPLFEQADVDYSDETIIRREILPSGKSRSFVNETPASVAFLKALSPRLIDVHSQHQNMLLNQSSFHLDVVDAMAKTANELSAYSAAYAAMKAKQRELQDLQEANARQGKELEYDRHILGELEKAKLEDPDELEKLEKQQQIQDRAEDIKETLASAINALDADETGIISLLGNTIRKVEHISDILPHDADIPSRLDSAKIELEDIRRTLQDIAENVEFDADELQRLTDRLNLLNSLTQRHSVRTVGDLISIRDGLREKISAIDSFDERLEELSSQLADLTSAAQKLADTLSAKREAVFCGITDYVETQLHEMGMTNARFVVNHEKCALRPDGQDNISFLFAANKNGQPTDIGKVASGGEMSRVMLSIKSLLSRSKSLPSIIFDEIDTGVSGDVADKMGRIMYEMSTHMQVLAITHLPQVAARGLQHYKVYKEDTEDKTVSHIKLLTEAERVDEIAKMLSGSHVTEAALANAKELLKTASMA